MGLSVDLKLACDNIEMNSKHKAFVMPIVRSGDKNSTEADAAATASMAVTANSSSEPLKLPVVWIWPIKL